MTPEIRYRLKRWSVRAGIVLGAVALVGSVAAGLPVIADISSARAAAVDRDFEDTGGVDLRWNPDTNVYSAATRPS
ncbi:MAG TPA: hypothetical protein VJG66_04880, partial [Patescibacteria group bacterium]|nr:hypothetical protein [Patescibacteria group bacterium]